MDSKSQAWRDGADRLLETLAVENKYVVADMMIIFLDSSGYGLKDWSPLGGVFKRARDRGIIKRVDHPTKKALWASLVYQGDSEKRKFSNNVINQPIFLEGFGSIDGEYIVTEAKEGNLSLRRIN